MPRKITTTVTFPSLASTILPNIVIDTVGTVVPQYCLNGNKPSEGDIFYYKSIYMKNNINVEGVIRSVYYDSITSTNGCNYKFSEIKTISKINLRDEKLNKIFKHMRTKILNTISDLCTNFVYYDRKEDDELSISDLEDAVNSGLITIDEMVAEFRKNLEQSLLK